MEYNLIIVKYGEIALKGNNRHFFEKALRDNMKIALRYIDNTAITTENGRFFVEFENKDFEKCVDALKKVFGIVAICPAYKIENHEEDIYQSAKKQVKEMLESYPRLKTFKVETRRPNKSFPHKSPEFSAMVGSQILQTIEGLKVDVKNPDFYVNIEIRKSTYIYCEEIPCLGGMPYKVAGKSVLLLSGGIDSPVAGYLMAKRGMEIEGLHFHSYPYTSQRAQEKVFTLAKKITAYTGRLKVTSVNLLEIQQAIMEKCKEEQMTVLSRSFMMLIANEYAKRNNCLGVVTGESLGQVASQTMEGINVTNSKSEFPVYRPLIAMDKLDIIKISQEIDTYETSILPFEDCCTVFLPKRVSTRPRIDDINKSLELLDVEALVKNAIDKAESIVIRNDW